MGDSSEEAVCLGYKETESTTISQPKGKSKMDKIYNEQNTTKIISITNLKIFENFN